MKKTFWDKFEDAMISSKAPEHFPSKKNKKSETKDSPKSKDKKKNKKEKSKANLIEEAWEGVAFGDGITDAGGNGHVHSFYVTARKINDSEWVISGRTETSNDDDAPHNHMIVWRGKLETGADISLETIFADAGSDHQHRYRLKWTE